VDGWKGLRETWPVALVAGLVFGLAQYATSNFLSLPLTDIVAALLSAGAVVLLVRVRPPRHATVTTGAAADTREPVTVGGGGGGGDVTGGGPGTPDTTDASGHDDHTLDSRRDTVLAYMPYLIIIALFAIQQIPPIYDAVNAVTVKFNWPGLHVASQSGKPVSTLAFKFDWLAAAGTVLLIAGILTALVLRMRPGAAVAAYGRTLVQLRTAIPTVMAVLALAYVMNDSGQTLTLGSLLAGTGAFFAVLSPVLGWLGTAVTGSDTSSNSLFGALQVTAAKGAGLDPILLAAANSSGGVLGKMISPQNLAIAASAVAMSGREGEILRRVLLWSLVFLVGMCVLVYLQSTPVLGWMVVAG
jgi:lactate permease